MCDRRVREPRLTAPSTLASGHPLVPPIPEDIRLAVWELHAQLFDSVGFNPFLDGRHSVAWHGDRLPKELPDPIVVLVSLGEPREFLLRPKHGGASRTFIMPGRGDLLVTGGSTQRTWDHCVPQVAQAGRGSASPTATG
jgi:alkylated DNA repair dioxygenase AlkB